MTNLLIFPNKIVLCLRFLLAKNNFLFTKAFTHAKWSVKIQVLGETKKFLLLCQRIVYCFAQKRIVQQQHDSKRSLLHHNVFIAKQYLWFWMKQTAILEMKHG